VPVCEVDVHARTVANGNGDEAHVLSMEYAATPPGAPTYYHGTAPDALGFILADGLHASTAPPPSRICVDRISTCGLS
jgi:hypothetical protein